MCPMEAGLPLTRLEPGLRPPLPGAARRGSAWRMDIPAGQEDKNAKGREAADFRARGLYCVLASRRGD